MATPAREAENALLWIDSPGKAPVSIQLQRSVYRLGRSPDNDLAFPEDHRLSRHHLLMEPDADGWSIRDLHSRNGTQVNGRAVLDRVRLRHDDRITAGTLTIRFLNERSSRPIVVVEPTAPQESTVPPITTTLRSALETPRAHARALIKAGRELVSHRAMADLFQIILDISVEAVGASRGVLMTRENAHLNVRAHCGEGFRISSTVVNRVLDEFTSILIPDAFLDSRLAGQESIIAGKARSILAVPLQTDDRAIGLIYVDSREAGGGFSPDDLNLLTVMANIAAIRIENSRLVEMERAQALLAHDLQQAAEIQRGLLPNLPPPVTRWKMAGYNAPCRTVGGDYFDFLQLPDGRIGIVVGDVAGKGMPAALLMSGLHARVHLIFEESGSLPEQMKRLNRSFAEACPGNRFVTVLVAVLDPGTGEMSYVNAGHNPGLLLRADGAVERLETTGTVLGMFPAAIFEERSCRMDPGDALVLFSDGVTELANETGEEFGEQRLIEAVRRSRVGVPRPAIDSVREELGNFAGGALAPDDVTLVVVES